MSYSRVQKANHHKFCKVCKDAGKSESIYTSHFVRETPDRSSKVVCPTLLSQSCKHCGISGHTSGHCKKLKAVLYQEKCERNAVRRNSTQTKTKTVRPKNSFGALESLSDEEEEGEIKEYNNNFPSNMCVNSATEVVVKSARLNYADAVNTVPVPVPVLARSRAPSSAQQAGIVDAPFVSNDITNKFKYSTLSWADMESSDEEDEYSDDC